MDLPTIMIRSLRGLAIAGTVTLGATLWNPLHAQQDVKPLMDYPKKPSQNEWYFNQEQHKVWIYHNEAWQRIPCQDCRWVKLCNDHAIIRDGFHYMLVSASGRVVVANAPAIRCMNTFIIVGGKNRIEYLLDEEGDTVSALVDNCKIYADTLQGDRVYCFPQYSPGLERYNCADLRNWGMMDEQGQWRIEPKYDKPFQFINGRADVVFKARHYWIGEDGELLEE